VDLVVQLHPSASVEHKCNFMTIHSVVPKKFDAGLHCAALTTQCHHCATVQTITLFKANTDEDWVVILVAFCLNIGVHCF